MGQKNQKVIKTLQKIAEGIDDVGINDGEARHKLGRELKDTLTAGPQDNKATEQIEIYEVYEFK